MKLHWLPSATNCSQTYDRSRTGPVSWFEYLWRIEGRRSGLVCSAVLGTWRGQLQNIVARAFQRS